MSMGSSIWGTVAADVSTTDRSGTAERNATHTAPRAARRMVTLSAALVLATGAIALIALRPATSCDMADRYVAAVAQTWPAAKERATRGKSALMSCGGAVAAQSPPRQR